MGRFGTTWMLMKASWGVVANNKRLLILPILSTICLVIVIASFAAPVIYGNFGPSDTSTAATADAEAEFTWGIW